jgi:hypothetical protein
MTPKVGDLVKVMWIDIQSDGGWESGKWGLEPAECTTFGIFYGYDKGMMRLFASFNLEDKGERIVIPRSVVKKITIVERGVYGTKKSG